MFVSLLLVALVVALWLNGRFWRSHWTRKPTLTFVAPTTGRQDTCVVVWCGAYSDAATVYWDFVDVYQEVGWVCFVNSPLRGYSARLAMQVAYEAIQQRPDIKRIALSGLSLGGQTSLRFVQHNEEVQAFEIVGVTLRDVPLRVGHLRDSLAPYAKYVRPGPLFDLLASRLLMSFLFESLVTPKSSGVNVGQREYNLKRMLALKFSAFAEQSAAVADGFNYASIGAMPPTVLVYCRDRDDVIDGVAAEAELQAWLRHKSAYIITMRVEGGHAQLIEWLDASRSVLRQSFWALDLIA